MPKCESDESRKNRLDGARLNPKHLKIGNQQPSLEQRKVQRLSLLGVGSSDPKWCAPHRLAGEDIVCASVKIEGVVKTTDTV